MKWLGSLCSAFFVSLGLFVGTFIINQNNVSAVSDLTFTIDSSNQSNFDANCGSDCSSYHYLLVEDFPDVGFVYFFQPYSSNQFARLTIYYNSGLYGNVNYLLFYFDNCDQFKGNSSNWSNSVSFKITLSENNPFGSSPTGSLSISQNGTYDVTNYAEAVVNVPAEVIQGDYHDDLVSINNSILICASVCLILYFFYCIYRMLLKGRI